MIPLVRHFLTYMRAHNSRANKKSWINLTNPVLADPVLWIELLRRAKKVGIFINLVVTRRPTNIICWSGSYPFGLGGILLL